MKECVRYLLALVSSALASTVFTEPALGADIAKRVVSPLGGYAIFTPPGDVLPDAERARITAQIGANIARLRAEGRLADALKSSSPRLAWPVRIAEGGPGTTTYGISNFVDHDPALNSPRDYTCGTRTYDLLGAGHRGTDIYPIFGWRKMDNEEAVVVAAAPGTIVLKEDGNQDRTCGSFGSSSSDAMQWNAIHVRHADGSITWYGHLKKNSLTPKNVGDTVAEGEFLGAVGSSGLSTGPHTHFEVYDAAGALIDPWEGTCNPSTPLSWWKDQPAYYDPQIVMLMPSKENPATARFSPPCDATTHVAAPVPQSYFLQPAFYYAPGETAFFTAFVRDVQPGATIGYRLKRPDGTSYASASQSSSDPYFAGGIFYTSVTFPAGSSSGKWTMDVTFGGRTESIVVVVGQAAPATSTVVDFYNTGSDHFFRTANPDEAATIDAGGAGPGWLRTGDDFVALSRAATAYGANAVCRFYGSVMPGPNSHFYTGAQDECGGLRRLQDLIPGSEPRWNYEEIAFNAFVPANGTCRPEAPYPVYRLYDNRYAQNDSNHRYTTKSSAYHQQAALGWLKEGAVMCAVSTP